MENWYMFILNLKQTSLRNQFLVEKMVDASLALVNYWPLPILIVICDQYLQENEVQVSPITLDDPKADETRRSKDSISRGKAIHSCLSNIFITFLYKKCKWRTLTLIEVVIGDRCTHYNFDSADPSTMQAPCHILTKLNDIALHELS